MIQRVSDILEKEILILFIYRKRISFPFNSTLSEYFPRVNKLLISSGILFVDSVELLVLFVELKFDSFFFDRQKKEILLKLSQYNCMFF